MPKILLIFLQLLLQHPKDLVSAKKISLLWRYAQESCLFTRNGGRIDKYWPITSEYHHQAGFATGHYFHQDLLVANFIATNNPDRHIDVGSRISGFVAHVASYRKIELIDIRKLDPGPHQNISFVQLDLSSSSLEPEITDSISCLHAIEHFGLGRYGDPIDPKGHHKGFANLIKMLKPKGKLYISFPIANQNSIEFNAHRIFHPNDIFTWPNTVNSLTLDRFDYVNDQGDLVPNVSIDDVPSSLKYGCGIYTFTKI
ncbi:DUF268 domain-containing protein [Polynucleobacter sp. MG-6-Vaara-E2]|uniref:DUF268 domain-containing protein n=1 Tax=Polynucleobacter sp. MG-6-Vaara-E2 TaxID=2576932 RepID=UPI001BFD10D8|nr:DUF268 domain-containing protein [Polynucleobacter sp. MG-6-Vaara-E2]QWD96884.1 DUF268 domain-containing protein [Polynucleobacter sp. MG-6-Vaara-E2]